MLVVVGVHLGEVLPLLGKIVFREDRLNRTSRLTRATIDALVWVNIKQLRGLKCRLVFARMNAVYRTHVHTRRVLDAHAGLANDIRHESYYSRTLKPRMESRFAPLLLLIALGAPAGVRAQDLPSRPLTLAAGHVVLGTDLSFSTSTKNDTQAWFNYTDYEHNTLRLMRLGVTANIRLNDRVSFLGELRSENGESPQPYALYARLRPWKNRPVDIQAGRIPPTFGAFSRRAYANGNPLIGYPLAYQYLTSLRPDAVPADPDELLRMRARGWRPSYRLGDQSIATGMPLITAFRWDTGVQVHASGEHSSATVAVTTGTVSDPRTRDNNGGKQISGRVQWEPVVGLVLGGSGAHGPYLADTVRNLLGLPKASNERALGFDAEYSRDHWLIRGEGVWTQWEVPTLSSPLRAGSGFVEATYKVRPGLFVAARTDRLTFSRVTGSSQTRTWDAPVRRVETGLGAYVRRNLLARVTYQHNWRDGGLIRNRQQLTVQLQFWL
jgi:hypothetical protein